MTASPDRNRIMVRLLVNTDEGPPGTIAAVTPERFRKLEGFIEDLGSITLPPLDPPDGD